MAEDYKDRFTADLAKALLAYPFKLSLLEEGNPFAVGITQGFTTVSRMGVATKAIKSPAASDALQLIFDNPQAYLVNLEMLKKIESFGGDLTQTANGNQNLLHIIFMQDSPDAEAVKYLLDKGLDLDAKDANGKSPRSLAEADHRRVLAELVTDKAPEMALIGADTKHKIAGPEKTTTAPKRRKRSTGGNKA